MTADPVTPAELEAALALAETATPSGPWGVVTNRHPNCDGTPWGALEARHHPAGGAGSYPNGMTTTWSGRAGKANAEFLAAARLGWPRAARAALDAMRERDEAHRAGEDMNHKWTVELERAEAAEARVAALEGVLRPFAVAGAANADLECARIWAHDPSMRVFLRPGDETARGPVVRFGDFDRAASMLGLGIFAAVRLRAPLAPPAEAPCTEHPTDAPGSPDACGGGA